MDFKHQYSNTNGNGGILVSRTNEDSEVEQMIKDVDRRVGKGGMEKATQSPTVAQTPIAGHFCDKHQKEMKERTFRESVWFDHRRKVGEVWEQCKGFGYPSELKQAVEDSGGY